MKMPINPAMAEALQLTRAGNLAEAVLRIREALSNGAPAAAATPADVIDLHPRRSTILHRTPRPAPPETRGHGRFEERTYRAGSATLRYRLYRPESAAPGMPLVIMLHGCTQSPEDFAAGTGMNRLADELGFLVAYPGQTQAANAQKCWNWFNPSDQQRDRGEPALIAGCTREIIAAEAADPARVYVAGLSAGGAAAAIMASAYPDLYAAVGIHSGLACGSAHDVPSALMAMKRGGNAKAPATRPGRFVPVITFHGDRDRTVDKVNSADIIAAAATAAGVPLTTRTEHGQTPDGRAFTREVSADPSGAALIEQWTVEGAGHAWSGGSAAGSYTDPAGPDASREMLRFFMEHRLAGA